MLADYRVVWSAEPGIDLLTGPAVVVRAYYESSVGALFGGTADFLYPGFYHAVPRDAPPPAPKWPIGEKPYPYPLVGTDRNHILRIETSGTNVTAAFCNWGYDVTDDLRDGKYGLHGPPQQPDYDAIFAEWLALTPPPSGATPLPPQIGPAKTCVATAPDPLSRRQFLTRGVHPRSDFPTLAPFPGWPAASAQ